MNLLISSLFGWIRYNVFRPQHHFFHDCLKKYTRLWLEWLSHFKTLPTFSEGENDAEVGS